MVLKVFYKRILYGVYNFPITAEFVERMLVTPSIFSQAIPPKVSCVCCRFLSTP